jgi:hypothetical protein
MNSFGVEKAVTFRQPSTANLMIDSADRPNSDTTTPYDFQISRNQSIVNGFFSRAGVTEVVLEWCQDNVTTANNFITFDISGTGGNTFAGAITRTIAPGLYTAAGALDSLVKSLNDVSGSTGCFWAIDNTSPPSGTNFSLTCDDGFFTVSGSALAEQLGIAFDASVLVAGTSTAILLSCIDLRPYRYIDFVSSQLTYPQDLKDGSTQMMSRDVLCRWYFADDEPEEVDAYGFPILMGYRRFCRRRIFNPPKQIKWDNNLPIGNLSFQVYDPAGALLEEPDDVTKNNFLMTIQLSEN